MYSSGPINPNFSGPLGTDDRTLEDCRARFDAPTAMFSEKLVSVSYTSGSWTQARINEWQHRIFNLRTADPVAVYEKLHSEHTELFTALREHLNENTIETRDKLAFEIADNMVVLYHLCGVLDIDIHGYIDRKMDINERRKWNVTEGGSGQHVEGT